jgi:hypothetical protein
VNAQVGVDPGEDQAGGEGRRQKREHRRVHHLVPAFLIASTRRLMS